MNLCALSRLRSIAALACLPLVTAAFALTPASASADSSFCLFSNTYQYADTQAAQAPNGDMRYLAEEVRCLMNVERARAGLPALPSNATLRNLAVAYAQDMVARKYFSHTSPGGSTTASRAYAAGYSPIGGRQYYLGENLAWGSGGYGTPRYVVSAWMNSAPHRYNILFSGYREIGVGAALGAPVSSSYPNAATYVAEFGAR